MNGGQIRGLIEALPKMSAVERAEVCRLIEHVTPAPPPLTFREFVKRVEPAYTWHRHNEVMHDRVMELIRGTLTRLAVFMPVRHGKSLTFSQLFTAYYQYCFPQRFVGLASATEPLAGYHAHHSKMYLQRITNAFSDPRELARVRLSLSARGGGLWSAGVGGSIIGFGASLLVADDLVKSAADAASKPIQIRNNEWWESTFTTRAQPNAAILLVMTRWHPNDITSHIMRMTAAGGVHADPWHIIPFDAIRDTKDPWDFPGNCTVEADWRSDGEALSPLQFPIERLIAKRAVTSAHTWAAVYQQRPRAKDGNIFKVGKIIEVPTFPAETTGIVRYWDTAATSVADSLTGDPDYTAGVRMSSSLIEESRIFTVEDMVAVQQEPSERNASMKLAADKDARDRGRGRVKTIIENQAGPGGTKATANMIGAMAPHKVEGRPNPGTDKELTADGFASQVNAGNVRIVKGEWNAQFILWLSGFPFADHDDAVDAASGAFNELFVAPVAVTVAAAGVPLEDPYDV